MDSLRPMVGLFPPSMVVGHGAVVVQPRYILYSLLYIATDIWQAPSGKASNNEKKRRKNEAKQREDEK